MKTRVVHISQPHDVKICRRKDGKVPNPPENGCFGNPFLLKNINDDKERDEVCEKYKEYFYKRIEGDPAFKLAVESLKGKTLACFCKPKRCHGDTIKEYLDGLS